jgi:hypothetical protein
MEPGCEVMPQFMRAQNQHDAEGIRPAAPDFRQLARRFNQQFFTECNRCPGVQQAHHREDKQNGIRPPGPGLRIKPTFDNLDHMRVVTFPKHREHIQRR